MIKVPKIIVTLGLGTILVLVILSRSAFHRPNPSGVESLQVAYSTPNPQIINTPTQKAVQTGDHPLCSTTAVGSDITCQIPQAFCSYQSGVNGSPTFCNDARYPHHNFTLLVWGQDWSDYDGQCLIVSGKVTIYNGKLQIEADDRSQVTGCDK